MPTFLYMTDLHARGTSPRSRKDDYPKALRRKLAEVRELAAQFGCKAVLCGGDFTDSPDVAESVLSDLIEDLLAFPCPVYGVWGNTHDIWGDEPATLHRTALGVLEAAKAIHLLRPGEPIFLEEDGIRIQVTGQGFHREMDRRDYRLDYCVYPKGITGGVMKSGSPLPCRKDINTGVTPT